MAPFHLLDQPIPSSTSAHPADLNVSPSSAPFSGQERAAAMGPVVNFFCFIVQISSFVYTWPCAASAASTNGSTSTIILIAVPAAQPDACATTAWMAPFHLLDQPIPSSTSAHPADLNVSPSSAPFSGQERAAAMGPVVNFFCFIVQVGNRPSLYSKRSSDTCLLLFPGPSVIYDNVSECFHVLKLLLCGDIESNPGPDDKVLTAIASLSAKVDSRHAELLAVLNQVQTNQSLLEQKVTDLSSRLATVETMVESYDSGHHILDLPQAVNTVIRNETTALHSRLDELEDRSRRDNLIFFGIADNVSEGWAQSEKIITDLISQKLDLNLSNEAIQRAHRLGAYVPNKCRPIIVKFQSSKIKDNVFYQRKKFQPSKVSVSEDFSRATRQCRKKLHEFGKNSGQPYSLRVNKLYINKTVYVYCHVTDRVCELETREERNNSNIGNTSPVTLPAAASLPAPAT
ncbi:uncharacterized protein LOC119175530 [Rhipicephalus microplus]|uniref:uncharacterized protein LOC119175530 n=1 Tax=Rhipicephalus microplus TaxID=6941 RepID=UPI003F6AAF3F